MLGSPFTARLLLTFFCPSASLISSFLWDDLVRCVVQPTFLGFRCPFLASCPLLLSWRFFVTRIALRAEQVAISSGPLEDASFFFFHEGVSQALLPQLLRRRGHPSNCATCRLILMNRITSDARVISLDSILKRVDTSSLDPARCYCSVVNCFNQLFVVFLVLKQRAKNRGGMLKLTLVQGLQCIHEVWLFLKHRLVRL